MSPWQQPLCVCVCVVWCDGMKWRVCLLFLRGPQLESLSQPNILFILSPNYWHDLVCITYCKWVPCFFVSFTSHNQPMRSSCDWWRSWNSKICLLCWGPRPPSGNHTFKTHLSVNPGLAPPGCVHLFKQELYLLSVGSSIGLLGTGDSLWLQDIQGAAKCLDLLGHAFCCRSVRWRSRSLKSRPGWIGGPTVLRLPALLCVRMWSGFLSHGLEHPVSHWSTESIARSLLSFFNNCTS